MLSLLILSSFVIKSYDSTHMIMSVRYQNEMLRDKFQMSKMLVVRAVNILYTNICHIP